ncbi:hypothetical protein WR25_03118 [Diploscapter pachys]|uniref:purine-nucleoside phosphorylase n=1 Tax=Diploscapter pachys TaxID=2018661 RepID=A0A2A2KHV8_9BILA|nr:hypothetical protein WR25_03118 [Diploscapter pachys]
MTPPANDETNGVDNTISALNDSKEYKHYDYSMVNPRNYDDITKVVQSIIAQVGEDKAKSDIVQGHAGKLIFGTIHGKKVICQAGRFHPYEHKMDLALCAMPIRVMDQLGVRTLIVTNAAGGVNKSFHYGDLMLIKDQIFLPGLAGFSPLVGEHDKRYGGPRFVSMHECFDKDLRVLTKDIANRMSMRLMEGVYVMSGGPQYETPAEVRLYHAVGADALGMSTCHEVVVAKQCLMKVNHLEVIDAANKQGGKGVDLISALVKELPPPMSKQETAKLWGY